jgi:hypothetical protein
MITTLPRKIVTEIICPICQNTKKEWNVHHFKTSKIKICCDCHNDMNYYLAPYEQKRFEKKDIYLIKYLIRERKESEYDR